jgi:hypothetical protein
VKTHLNPQLPNPEPEFYMLNAIDMQKLDELITELQCIYCDIYANRSLSLTKDQNDRRECDRVEGLMLKNKIDAK